MPTIGSRSSMPPSAGAFRPQALVIDSVDRVAKKIHSPRDVIRLISSKAMRFSLYMQLYESGMREIDGVDVSVEWSLAMLVYSGFDMVHTTFLPKEMVHRGYPKFLRKLDEEYGTYRIYTRSREVADAIVEGGSLLASHNGHVVSPDRVRENYVDITGVFITRPEVPPSKVWLDEASYGHFVDFRLPPATAVLSLDLQDRALLIPGPARFREEDIEKAMGLPADSYHESHPLWDLVSLTQVYGQEIPEFRIPIDVTETGQFDVASGLVGAAGAGSIGMASFAASSIACLSQAAIWAPK